MKSNKVLIGLFAGFLALVGGTARAQFYELGPANIGGHVTSLAIDRQDGENITVYAGAATGGLFLRTNNTDVLEKLYAGVTDKDLAEKMIANTDIWHRVKFVDESGLETSLPISAMAILTDGSLVIGTGQDVYGWGSTYSKMSSKGRGVYHYSLADGSYKMLSYTDPERNSLFEAVHDVQIFAASEATYVFVGTPNGLFRWTITDEASWNSTPVRISNANVDQILPIRQLGIAYFTSGNKLYRISDMAAADNAVVCTDISSSNKAFGGSNKAIKLAVAPSDNSYLYAMVIDTLGGLEDVYLTTTGQVWTPVATESVMPFVANSGLECGAIYVDPLNEKRIIIAGTNIWIGEGHSDGARYQWTKHSYSEMELNGGDYMSNVYNSVVFVHSGIHQIASVFVDEAPVSAYDEYYFATDGGVYSTVNFYSFTNLNLGMNNVQVNGVAVCPDGSVISGANANANPFIGSRMAHNGGNADISWFDDGSLGNLNHNANVLYSGNGGKVAASQFQRIEPKVQRNIFVSSSNGRIGRSYDDYFDYTNTTTWTTGGQFLTNAVKSGPAIGNICLWESANDSLLIDSIDVEIDLYGTITRANGTIDSLHGDGNVVVRAGDRAIFLDRGNSDYPFEHVFTKAEDGKKAGSTFRVKSPVASRMLAVVGTGTNSSSVLYSWTANDFSKIYDSVIDNDIALDATVKSEARKKFMWWAPIFTVDRLSLMGTANIYPRNAVMSADGRTVYVSTYNTSTHRSQLYRVHGFDNVDFTEYPTEISRKIDASSGPAVRKVKQSVFSRRINYQDEEWFSRPISSIAVDPRPGMDRIVLTFEDYDESYDNVAIINKASTDEWEIEGIAIDQQLGLPAYCAMIEQESGDIYVGTENGVYIYNGTAWRHYEEMRGVPVTSIVQQTANLAVQRVIRNSAVDHDKYLWAKTKWPNAIYFGTYGRGIFMDMSHVTDTVNEISDSVDYNPPVDIPTVAGNGKSSVSVYPNPVAGDANISIDVVEEGVAAIRVYDLNGRLVASRSLGRLGQGNVNVTLSTEGMAKGMYLVNVIIGGHTSATKMIVR
ncbi:MAG: T9SS type A sorting domain-containing protein [Bacteroidales bacterium]|nr:T9SS type A sorting domain-containing protein [Bacteroidales bacterium]